MWTVEFWRNLLERAIKTAAQFAIGSGIAGATNVLDLDLLTVLGAAGMGALLSVLTSIGTEAIPLGNPNTASLTRSVIAVGPGPKVRDDPEDLDRE